MLSIIRQVPIQQKQYLTTSATSRSGMGAENLTNTRKSTAYRKLGPNTLSFKHGAKIQTNAVPTSSQTKKDARATTATTKPKKKISRKLRKSCSLDTCNQKPGECMHCTCDGRCGQHVAGKCGVRREGSGKNCKRDDCPKDDTCLHSTRATCCHCRNLVSSHSRSLKAKRAKQGNSMYVSPPQTSNPMIAVSTPPLDDTRPLKRFRSNNTINPVVKPKLTPVMPVATMEDLVLPPKQIKVHTKPSLRPSLQVPEVQKNIALVKTLPSLCEFAAWSSRRHLCNLIVIVEGKQFNLHKFPMLVQCRGLNKRVKKERAAEGYVPTVTYKAFPGGSEAFELACIYAYTHTIQGWTPRHIALLFCASRYLGMTTDVGGLDESIESKTNSYRTNLAKRTAVCMEDVIDNGNTVEVVDLLLALHALQETWRNHSENDIGTKFGELLDQLIMACVNRIAKDYPFDISQMAFMLNLPCELFLHVTQRIICQSTCKLSKNVIAILCAQVHLAQAFGSTRTPVEKCRVLHHILNQTLRAESQSSGAAQLVMKVAKDVGLDSFASRSPAKTSPSNGPRSTGRILAQALLQASSADATF